MQLLPPERRSARPTRGRRAVHGHPPPNQAGPDGGNVLRADRPESGVTAPVARPEPHERSGRYFGIGLGLVFTVAVLVMYRPSWSSMTGTLPWNLGDPALNTWILSWESHALLHDVGGFFEGN